MIDLDRGTKRWSWIERRKWRNLDWQRSKEHDIVTAKIDIKGKRKEV